MNDQKNFPTSMPNQGILIWAYYGIAKLVIEKIHQNVPFNGKHSPTWNGLNGIMEKRPQ